MTSPSPTVPKTSTKDVSLKPKFLQVGHSVPIIVGVTGHRDLRPEDVEPLRNQIRSIFENLRHSYPSTSLLVMSPLSEGADRLVAQTALEHVIENRPRATLMVPLPMPLAEYEKDFHTEESLAEFRRLLSRSLSWFELPQLPGSNRNQQYAQVGAYVARHSHILIALWDGADTGREGGTAQIVQFKLNGIPAPYETPRKPLDIVDNGPVYHILTPRINNPKPAGTPFTLQTKFPHGWEASDLQTSYNKILARMDQFNSDAERLLPKSQAKLNENKEKVIASSQESVLSPQVRFILDRYAAVDTLAQHYKLWRRVTLLVLFCVAVAAVLSFEFYAHLFTKQPVVLTLYPLSLGLAVFVYSLARRREVQNKHLDYRVLAEGLRVQLFWNIARLPNEVANHYLRQHRTELEWIRNAIRSWNALGAHLTETPTDSSAEIDPPFDLILKNWIEKQRKFFSDASYEDNENLRTNLRLVKGLFLFGLAIAAILAVIHFLSAQQTEHSIIWHLLIVTIGILPAIAAAVGGYAEKMAFSAQAKRYEWMTALFTRALERLRHLIRDDQYTQARELILDLGKEALEENGNWVAVHRERTPDVFKGS